MDVAEQAGISEGHLSKIETGRAFPSETTLANLAAVLRVDPMVLRKPTIDRSHFEAQST